MRAVVCGPRDWTDSWSINCALTIIRAEWDAGKSMGDWPARDLPVIVHGDARGADRMAAQWAVGGFDIEPHPADWDGLGKRAGIVRNHRMLKTGIDLVVAVAPRTGLTTGTKHMVTIAREAGVRTLVLVP